MVEDEGLIMFEGDDTLAVDEDNCRRLLGGRSLFGDRE